MRARSVADRGWVFGPLPDLFLGCGLGYALLAGGAALVAADPAVLRASGAALATLAGMPHYGATLLRVYERREDRRRYTVFAVWASLVVWLVCVASVYHQWLGSLFVTVYLTWSPWHYTGQNYGLSVMFARRRGGVIAPGTKRWLYASFVLSCALFLLTLHGGNAGSSYAGSIDVLALGEVYKFLSLGIPARVTAVLFPVGLLAWLVATAVALWQLRRAASPAALLPCVLLIATQAAWISVPAAGVWITGRDPRDHVLLFFVWVTTGHAVQYLWITTYYAAGTRPARERLAYLGKTFLAGAGVWTLPPLLFSPALLGRVSFDLGLFLVVGAAVNIQHFILDGAIWKLRDGRVARILLGAPERAAPPPSERSAFGGRLVYAACVPLAAIAVGGLLAPALWWAAVRQGDDAWAGRVERALAWVGRDEPRFHERRAVQRVSAGDLAGAQAAYDRSLEITPTPSAWSGLGEVRALLGDADGARQCYEHSLAIRLTPEAWVGMGAVREFEGDPAAVDAYGAALALDPNNLDALTRLGQYWIRHGRPDRALPLLAQAAAIAPDDPTIRADLAQIHAGELR